MECHGFQRWQFNCQVSLQQLQITVSWEAGIWGQCLVYMRPCLTFSSSTFCPHSVFMCFVWIWEQTAIISLYNINWLVFITETECVYCAVRTESLYINQVIWVCRTLNVTVNSRHCAVCQRICSWSFSQSSKLATYFSWNSCKTRDLFVGKQHVLAWFYPDFSSTTSILSFPVTTN
jgi:hypothetical protein